MTRYIAFNQVGRFHSIDDTSGHWTTNDEIGGSWISDDGSKLEVGHMIVTQNTLEPGGTMITRPVDNGYLQKMTH